MSTAGNSTTMNHYTDEELDRDWKPNGRRPQSYVFPTPSLALPPYLSNNLS